MKFVYSFVFSLMGLMLTLLAFAFAFYSLQDLLLSQSSNPIISELLIKPLQPLLDGFNLEGLFSQGTFKF